MQNGNPTSYVLDYSKDEVEFSKYTLATNSTKKSSINLLTTLRGNSNVSLLKELADSILPELVYIDALWIVFVHGEQSDEMKQFLQELSLNNNLNVIVDQRPHSLYQAMSLAIKNVDSEWILLADYDDQLLPGAITFISEVTKDDKINLIIGSELIGESIGSSAYYNRPIFSKLGLRLFSLFFHPIAVREESLENLISKNCDYVLDWEIIRKHINGGRIVQVQAPMYFWRSHPASISN